MSDITRAFNVVSDVYEDWYRTPQGIQVYHAELRGLERLLPPVGLGIEIGAGTGVFAYCLEGRGRIIICLDPSPGMLTKTLRKGLHTLIGVGEAMPFRRQVFDFAYMVAVIEFLSDPKIVLEAIHGMLKINSPIITLTINRSSSWGAFYKKLAQDGEPIFCHAKFYDMDEVESALSDAGFTIVESLSTLTNPPNDYDIGTELTSGSVEAGVVICRAIKAEAGENVEQEKWVK